MHMRPGAYLAKRREAAGFSVEDVAVHIATEPRLNLRDRVDWLRRIEEDVDPITPGAAAALAQVYRFSAPVLQNLLHLQAGLHVTLEHRLCSTCGCSELDACVDGKGRGCHWVSEDTCSSCVRAAEESAA